MSAKPKRQKSDIERDADRELRWDRPPRVRSQREASRLYAWLRIFQDEQPAPPPPTRQMLAAQQRFLARIEQLSGGVVYEPEDRERYERAEFVVQCEAAKLSKYREARARWVDALAVEFEIEHHRKELNEAIKEAARAYYIAIIRDWRPRLGRGDTRSARKFFAHVEAAAAELRGNEALRNRLEDAAQLINRVDTGDPRDEILVGPATGALGTLLALKSVAVQLLAKKPRRGSHTPIRSACKPLRLLWTGVAGRNGALYHSGEEASPMAQFLSHCLLLFDRSATPRTIERACE